MPYFSYIKFLFITYYICFVNKNARIYIFLIFLTNQVIHISNFKRTKLERLRPQPSRPVSLSL